MSVPANCSHEVAPVIPNRSPQQLGWKGLAKTACDGAWKRVKDWSEPQIEPRVSPIESLGEWPEVTVPYTELLASLQALETSEADVSSIYTETADSAGETRPEVFGQTARLLTAYGEFAQKMHELIAGKVVAYDAHLKAKFEEAFDAHGSNSPYATPLSRVAELSKAISDYHDRLGALSGDFDDANYTHQRAQEGVASIGIATKSLFDRDREALIAVERKKRGMAAEGDQSFPGASLLYQGPSDAEREAREERVGQLNREYAMLIVDIESAIKTGQLKVVDANTLKGEVTTELEKLATILLSEIEDAQATMASLVEKMTRVVEAARMTGMLSTTKRDPLGD